MGRSNPSVRTAGAQRGMNPFLDGAFASPNKKSTTSASPSKSRNPSPKKQQRIAEDALRQEEAEAKAALAQVEGMLANFEIEGQSPGWTPSAADGPITPADPRTLPRASGAVLHMY
jgi:hypothetical protein